MNAQGKFFGVGVGPGQQGLLPMLAVQALHSCKVILCPKSKSASFSVAKNCVRDLGISEECFEIVEYGMEDERASAFDNYLSLAKRVAKGIANGENIAYLTIGDVLTYSTFSYLVMALRELLPELEITSFPGITSYTALAAKFNWPLGQGKEKVLILPCPDSAEELRQDIESHDIVVLMKIGRRLPMVLKTIEEMQITSNCVFGSRMGLSGEIADQLVNLGEFAHEKSGYLATILIRQFPPQMPWFLEPVEHLKKEYA